MATTAIAVIDVETTGLFPFRNDRVVEVAAILVGADGRVEREFESLVNPGRDIGPSSIHGLTATDILDAPGFEAIAAGVLGVLDGAVAIAGHNVRFDRQFLHAEFSRLGFPLPECPSICTMQLAGGGSLEECCRDFGLPAEAEKHVALADARATARLLVRLLADHPRLMQQLRDSAAIRWPLLPNVSIQPVTREESRRKQSEPPTYLKRLLRRRNEPALSEASDGAVIAYGALLDRALEDRHIDADEADALVETANYWGLSGNQIEYAHRSYLDQLVIAAVLDGAVTDAERRDLRTAGRLLGQSHRDWDNMLGEAAAKLAGTRKYARREHATVSSLTGQKVCFTGELQCTYNERPITRQIAEELSAKAGLVVMDSVTRACDLLVLADPNSQSGKAQRAHKYGVRIMQEVVFWKAIGVRI
jgi:DNA polymerase III subunit epsilon